MKQENESWWPPDTLLELIGLTRKEWNEMDKEIQQDALKKETVIMEALQASVRRRADDNLRKRVEPYRKPNTN